MEKNAQQEIKQGPTCILNEDTHPVTRAIGVSHTQLTKMSFDEKFDLTAGERLFFSCDLFRCAWLTVIFSNFQLFPHSLTSMNVFPFSSRCPSYILHVTFGWYASYKEPTHPWCILLDK